MCNDNVTHVPPNKHNTKYIVTKLANKSLLNLSMLAVVVIVAFMIVYDESE